MTREEAIEVIKRTKGAMIYTEKEKEALETLIPEFAESEDERMLREIKRYIKEQGDKPTGLPNGTVAVADMIAWLEKQKEYVSNNFDDVWNEEDCEEIIAEGQKLTPRFKELLKEVCHAWYDRGTKLEKQKEQKHPDGCFTCGEYKKGYEAGRLNGFTAGYNKAMKEQKPAEWSEEDETQLTNTLIMLKEYAIHHYSKDDVEKSVDWLENRVKFFLSQYHGDVTMTEAYKMGKEAGEASHWKPTEHQMTILKAVKEYVGKGSGYWGEGLGSLINDLEKLI